VSKEQKRISAQLAALGPKIEIEAVKRRTNTCNKYKNIHIQQQQQQQQQQQLEKQ